MAAALLTRAARGGALSGGLDLTRALSSEARAAHAAAAAAIKATGGTGTGVHGAATALSGGGGAASSLTRAGASRLAGVRSMSTANGHSAVELLEREILQLRKELLDEVRKNQALHGELRKELLDEVRKNQALYGELAEQTRFVREYVTIKAETAMTKNSYGLLGCAAAFVFSMVNFGAPYAEEVWRQRTIEAMEKKYGLVAIPRGRGSGTLPHPEGGSAAAPPPAARAPHGEDKKQGPK